MAVLLAAGMNVPRNAVLGSLAENALFHLSLHCRHYCSNNRNAHSSIKGAQIHRAVEHPRITGVCRAKSRAVEITQHKAK